MEIIKKWAHSGIIDGVTTNPSHLSVQGKNPREHILEICKLLAQADISVEITEQEPQAVYTQAKEIAALSKNITVKIPCAVEYYPIIKKLVAEGIGINITLVFTLIQGIMMCKLGVKYISPFVGRLHDIDVDGIQLIHDLRNAIDSYGYETQILAASVRSVRDFHEVITAGADVATLPPEVLEKSVHHILTDQGMQKFDADWKKLGISKFP